MSRCARTRTAAVASALGVLGDVGQRLGHDEVGGRLDRRRQPLALAPRSSSTGSGERAGERLERRAQAAVGQDGRVDAARQLAQLLQRAGRARRARRRACACGAARDRRASWRLARPSCSESATRRCWAPSCRSRSSAPALGIADLDEPRARGAQLVDAGAQLGLQALVLQRQGGRGGRPRARARARRPAPASWMIAPTRLPSRSTSVTARPEPAVGQLDRAPVEVDVVPGGRATSRRAAASGRPARRPARRAATSASRVSLRRSRARRRRRRASSGCAPGRPGRRTAATAKAISASRLGDVADLARQPEHVAEAGDTASSDHQRHARSTASAPARAAAAAWPPRRLRTSSTQGRRPARHGDEGRRCSRRRRRGRARRRRRRRCPGAGPSDRPRVAAEQEERQRARRARRGSRRRSVARWAAVSRRPSGTRAPGGRR